MLGAGSWAQATADCIAEMNACTVGIIRTNGTYLEGQWYGDGIQGTDDVIYLYSSSTGQQVLGGAWRAVIYHTPRTD